jgi:spermidine/putrescine transport system ATP-binding protein
MTVPLPIVRFRAVVKRYGSKTVLPGLDLEVGEGEFLTLLGPSGCGKTTVLRLLAGFETPDAGEILLDGRLVNTIPPESRNVHTVFQSYALFPHMTVFDNVAFGLRMRRLRANEIRRRVEEALALVHLADFGSRRPHQLSGGQQQRVALARALVNRPRVLLLDECLSALDYKLRRAMQIELKAVQRQTGIAFVFVTHDQEEALSMSDRVVVMREGRVEQVGSPRDIYENPANLFVATFVGESNVLDAVITARTDTDTYHARVEGVSLTIRSERAFAVGAAVKLVLRPEDLHVKETSTGASSALTGTVVERTYKGVTLDTLIALDSGHIIKASEFFSEEAPSLDHPIGRRVTLSWIPGWEIILPAAADREEEIV